MYSDGVSLVAHYNYKAYIGTRICNFIILLYAYVIPTSEY